MDIYRFLRLTFTLLFISFLFLRIGISQVSAVVTDVFLQREQTPSSLTLCQTDNCQPPPSEFCWNSQSPGVTSCGYACPGGSPWTKYGYLDCYQTGERECERTWQFADAVYSTADKCSDGSNNPPFEQYLRSGQCDGNIGGIYKTCCSNDGGISSNSCVPITPSSGAPTPPMDGVCPGGSYWVMCGVDQATCNEVNAIYGPGKCTTDACGPAVCGSIAPPPEPTSEPVPTSEPPPPTPTPEPVCVANSWDSTLCARCKADGSGYNAGCSDFGSNPPSPGNDWCSCDQRCPGADNPACSLSFTVSCSANPNPASTNQSVTWTGAPNPTGTYTYSWSGTAITGATNTANPGSVLSFSKSYSASGTKTANITATRSSDGISAQNSCTDTINTPSSCDITSASLNPVTWNTATSAYNFTQINWTSSDTEGSRLYYYIPGTCSQNSCPVTGWSLLVSASIDGSFGYVWNPNPQSPAQGSTHTIGLTGSDNILCDTYNISFGTQSTCTLTANPTADTTSPYATTLSASVDTTGMPPSKMSQWDCNGDGTFEFEDVLSSRSCSSYNSAGTYNPAFRVVTAPGSSTVLSRCSTAFTAGTASGPTPTPPPSCNPQEPPNNAPTVTLRPDGHTVDIVYVYGLPEDNDDDNDDDNDIQGVSTQRITPDNPIQNIWLKLMEFFKAKLTFGAAAPPYIGGEIYRSDSRGFIPAGGIGKTETGTQFGSVGHSFDRDPPTNKDEKRIAYYQLQAQSGTETKYSNTSGVLINEEGDRDCDLGTYSNRPNLQSAAQVSSTATTLTFDLIYKVFPRIFTCGSDPCTPPSHTPPFLQIQRSSAQTPGYIPWGSAISRVNTANKENRDDDIIESTWKATYVIDLPPETTENLTITGYHEGQCDDVAKIGTVTLNNASTRTGIPPPVINPRLSTKSMARDKEKEPFVPMSWLETQNGQVVKSYRSSNRRWDTEDYVDTKGTFENGKWVFRATDDLDTLTTGKTYYYGIQLNMKGLVGTECNGYSQGELVFSDQAGIYWDIKPWIKTTSGDVHSQEGINTPGGP